MMNQDSGKQADGSPQTTTTAAMDTEMVDSTTTGEAIEVKGVPAAMSQTSIGFAQQSSHSLTNRLSLGRKPKGSYKSRLQLISAQLKLSDRLVMTPFVDTNKFSQTLDGFGNNAEQETASSSPLFSDEYTVSACDEFYGEGRYGTVKKCRRIADKKVYAVKEVRSNISDDFDKACLENKIMVRLNLANHENIVRQVSFFRDLSKQTTQLVMEALNGMTLLETLQDETDPDGELDNFMMGPGADANPFGEAVEESKEAARPRLSGLIKPRRQSIRTPAIAGLKRQLTAIKKTYFNEHEARPLATQLISGLVKMHKLGIVHRDLNPGNIFLHFPDLPVPDSPPENNSSQGTVAELISHANPVQKVIGSQIKIIDFNQSRMFNLDDSPIRLRQRKHYFSRQDLTEEEKWQELGEANSPDHLRTSPLRLQQDSAMKDQAAKPEPAQAPLDDQNRMQSVSLMGGQKQSSHSIASNASSDVAARHGTMGSVQQGQRFKMFSPRIGTPIYRAPEILSRGQMYSEAIDLWSAGCCIYYMLVGRTPFKEIQDMNALNREIREGTFIKSRERYQALSPMAKDLIEGLMNKDVNKRLTAQQALQHPWMQAKGELLKMDDAIELSSSSSSADSKSQISVSDDEDESPRMATNTEGNTEQE